MGKSHDLATIAADGLEVDTIKNTSGTTGLTIDNGGHVNLPSSNHITGFYLNTTFTISTGSFTYVTNWTKMNSSYFSFPNVGTEFSHSGGNFTTTKLGVYKVTLELHLQADNPNTSRWIDLRLLFTPSGGSAVGGDIYEHIGVENSAATYSTAHRIRYFNFTNAADKIQLGTQSEATTKIRGASNEYDTVIYFEWVAPPIT